MGLGRQERRPRFDKLRAANQKTGPRRIPMSADVKGKDETKLANGGGAFPFWVSVIIVTGFFAVLFAIVYGIVEIFS
jgi:hypothetical protein